MMRDLYEQQLELLNNELIEMGSLIETAIQMSVDAFMNRDIEKAKEAIEFETQTDKKDKEIENLCLSLILHQQPVASDLRLISSALKMITDMERIGDHASDIAEIVISMQDIEYVADPEPIEQMAKETMVMLIKSVDAFVNKNVDLAREVIAYDDKVDDLFDKSRRDIIELVHNDPAAGEQITDFLMIAKYFERIGDHATNIAEWVIYSVTGVHDSHTN